MFVIQVLTVISKTKIYYVEFWYQKNVWKRRRITYPVRCSNCARLNLEAALDMIAWTLSITWGLGESWKETMNNYSGDLDNEHLNNGNIWMTNFHLSGIQMSGIQMVVRYSDHHLNTGINLVRYSNGIRIKNHSVIGQLSTIWIPD